MCAGIAEYFGWDPTWVRLGWVLFTLLGGSGLLAYIIAATQSFPNDRITECLGNEQIESIKI